MSITLSEYVKRRNGVPLGAPGSLGKMLERSLGAGSFAVFWRYWNPVWSYYLSRYIMRPLAKSVPVWLAVILTFAVSGALHDLAVTLIKWRPTFFITPWFVLMGAAVVTTDALGITYQHRPWAVRALINAGLIALCCMATYAMM